MSVEVRIRLIPYNKFHAPSVKDIEEIVAQLEQIRKWIARGRNVVGRPLDDRGDWVPKKKKVSL